MFSDITKPTLSPQQQRVLDYLQAGHTLTNMVALTALGIGSLSSRVAELRKMGYVIDTRTAKSHDDRNYLKYDIGKQDGSTEG